MILKKRDLLNAPARAVCQVCLATTSLIAATRKKFHCACGGWMRVEWARCPPAVAHPPVAASDLTVANVVADGSCSAHGVGGWAALVDRAGTRTILTGWEANTTPTRMELRAVIQGLASVEEASCVVVRTDLKALSDKLWFRALTRGRLRDLGDELSAAVQRHRSVAILWVKGHSGDADHNLADLLAGDASARAAYWLSRGETPPAQDARIVEQNQSKETSDGPR